jgi:hypothetical protein
LSLYGSWNIVTNNNDGAEEKLPPYLKYPKHGPIMSLEEHYVKASTLSETTVSKPWWGYFRHIVEMICFKQRFKQLLLTANNEAKCVLKFQHIF